MGGQAGLVLHGLIEWRGAAGEDIRFKIQNSRDLLSFARKKEIHGLHSNEIHIQHNNRKIRGTNHLCTETNRKCTHEARW